MGQKRRFDLRPVIYDVPLTPDMGAHRVNWPYVPTAVILKPASPVGAKRRNRRLDL